MPNWNRFQIDTIIYVYNIYRFSHIYYIMGYYQTFIAKQEKQLKEAEELLKKEANKKHYEKYKDRGYHKKNYEKQKERARKYYWENREYVLARQQVKKFQTRDYYKQWYEKNKIQVNQVRYGDKAGSKTSKEKDKEKPIIKKPVSFIVSF